MLRAALLVLGKELRATVRDPHVLAYVLFPVVLYPAILLGTVALMSYRDGLLEHETWTIELQHAPDDVRGALLDGHVAGSGGLDALADGSTDVIVAITEDGPRLAARIDQISTRARSAAAADWVQEQLDEVRDERFDALLAERELTREDLQPVKVRRRIRNRERGGLAQWVAAMLLCAIIPSSMLVAGVYPAVELIVSERERGTLETTLVAPVSRVAVLAGKVGACVILMMAAGFGNATALALTANQMVFQITEKVEEMWIPPLSSVLGLPALVGCALLFAGVYLVTVLPARTFKEGEYAATFGTFFLFGPVLAGLYAVVTSAKTTAWLCFPIANAVIALYGSFQGEVEPAWLVVPALENGLLGAAMIALAARVLDREDTLFAHRLPRWLAWTRRWMPE